ncbi:MAG: archaeosortase A [Halodesulfurarchaeum sp.]
MSALTDALAWVVVALFAASAILYPREERLSRQVSIGAWVVFGLFWALLVPHFAFTQRSIIEGVLSALAVPASLYVALLIWRDRRDFATITRAVAIMGVLYLPFQTIAPLRDGSIEMVTRHVEFLIHTLGYDPTVVTGENGLRSTFVFVGPDGHRFTTRVLLACTGAGSAATVSGLVLAIRAPLRRRLLGVAIAVPIIYVLNVLRVAFIALAHGKQWFAGFKEPIFLLFGTSDPYLVSYLLADRVLAQSLSVLALVALTLGLLRLVPELSVVVEDVLFVLTGRDYDVEGLL